MMSYEKQVLVKLPDEEICECIMTISEEEPWEINLDGAGYKNLRFNASDLFNAFIEMRKELENSGSIILCNGARKDIFPSGMSRSMGGGRKAYILRKGLPTRSADIVDIFDYAEPALVSTFEQQQKFHEEWIASLG